MRDTDVGFTTKFVCKKGSRIQNIADLPGRRFGLGSTDSAQAAIMGLYYLQKESPKEVVIHEFDTQDEFNKKEML